MMTCNEFRLFAGIMESIMLLLFFLFLIMGGTGFLKWSGILHALNHTTVRGDKCESESFWVNCLYHCILANQVVQLPKSIKIILIKKKHEIMPIKIIVIFLF